MEISAVKNSLLYPWILAGSLFSGSSDCKAQSTENVNTPVSPAVAVIEEQVLTEEDIIDGLFIPSVENAEKFLKAGLIKNVTAGHHDQLGVVYKIEFNNGSMNYMHIGNDTERNKKFHELLHQNTPSIDVQVSLTAIQKAAYIALTMDLMLGAVIMFVLVKYAREMRKNSFQIVKSDTRFTDVRGNPENVASVKGLMELMKNAKNIHGAKPPKGILFVGPPGTGKTLLAKAVAGEMGYNFIECSGSDFDSPFVGVGKGKVKKLFNLARKKSPCIIFIDEIDGIGGERSESTDSVSKEQAKILNTLLVCMDGFTKNKDILVVGATNRKNVLDKALLRPGRFDRVIEIANPVSVEQRSDIIDLYLEKKKLETPVSTSVTAPEIAKITSLFSPAELAEIMNSAAFNALQLKKEIIDWEDIFEAVDRIKLGEKLQMTTINENDRERLAVHEFFGHYIMARLLEMEVCKVSLMPRQKALAHVAVKERDGLGIRTTTDYMKDLLLLLAGPAAEKVALNEHSNGATSDFHEARKLIEELYRNNMLEFNLLSRDDNGLN